MLLVNATLDFVGKWWNTFFLTFILACMVMGYLNLITGYAVIIMLLLCRAVVYLRRIAELLEQKNESK